MSRQPPNVIELQVGQIYEGKLANASKAGQLFIVVDSGHTADIDMEILKWTNYYLTTDVGRLTRLGINKPLRRIVVSVNRAASSVIRGLLTKVDMAFRKATVDCVDTGRTIEVTLDSVYEATPEVVKTKWKTVPCILHGTKMFIGTHFMEKALDHSDFIQTSRHLRFTIKGKERGHYIIDLACHAGNVRNVNTRTMTFLADMFAKWCRLTEKCLGSVTDITTNGVVSLIQVETDTTVLSCIDRFLSSITADKLRSQLSPATPNRIRMSAIYLAPFDGKVYRAKIVQCHVNSVDVEFIDYGNEGPVAYSDLFLAKDVDLGLANLPLLSKKAYLRWVQTLINYDAVYDLVYDSKFKVEWRKTELHGIPTVTLTDLRDGSILNKKLILDGLATKASSSAT